MAYYDDKDKNNRYVSYTCQERNPSFPKGYSVSSFELPTVDNKPGRSNFTSLTSDIDYLTKKSELNERAFPGHIILKMSVSDFSDGVREAYRQLESDLLLFNKPQNGILLRSREEEQKRLDAGYQGSLDRVNAAEQALREQLEAAVREGAISRFDANGSKLFNNFRVLRDRIGQDYAFRRKI